MEEGAEDQRQKRFQRRWALLGSAGVLVSLLTVVARRVCVYACTSGWEWEVCVYMCEYVRQSARTLCESLLFSLPVFVWVGSRMETQPGGSSSLTLSLPRAGQGKQGGWPS